MKNLPCIIPKLHIGQVFHILNLLPFSLSTLFHLISTNTCDSCLQYFFPGFLNINPIPTLKFKTVNMANVFTHK